MHLDKIIGRLESSERLLADAFMLVAKRHDRDPEIGDVARMIAAWSAQHVDVLERLRRKHGSAVTQQPAMLRDALFHDPRIGSLGLVEDLHDLGLLVHQVQLLWIELAQAARLRFDDELEEICGRAQEDVERQQKWVLMQIKHTAPQAIAVPSVKSREVRASVPRRLTLPALPDVLWGPPAAAALIVLAGVGALVTKQPWLLPSLGPSAYLVAVEPAHPSARAWSTIAGHVIGLAAGVAMTLVFGAWSDPMVLGPGTLTVGRALAAACALALTLLLAIPLKAPHPPAGATALLVALGALSTTRQALGLVAGAAIVALGGALLRRARIGVMGPSPREPAVRSHPSPAKLHA